MDDRSERNLMGVHADLVKVVRKTYDDWRATGGDLIVTEGLRSKDRQAELFRAGASMTMDSRHLTGHAVDLAIKVGGRVDWSWPMFHRLGPLMETNARTLGVKIVWGGRWQTFADGPHFELDRAFYP